MTTDKLPFPPNLPPLPEPPAGHQWVSRGQGWLSEFSCNYIYTAGGDGWSILIRGRGTCGEPNAHYAELIPIESPAEPDYASREYQLSVISAALDGKQYQYRIDPDGKWIDGSAIKPETAVANLGVHILSAAHVRIKPQPDPYADLKAAHKAGKPIQMLYEGIWTTWLSPDWTRPPEEYRIKPETKRIPLTAEDIPAVCWVRQHRSDNHPILVLQVMPDAIFCKVQACQPLGTDGDVHRTYQELMEDGWEYSENRRNWNPCCKETEE